MEIPKKERGIFEDQIINDGFVEFSGYSLEKDEFEDYVDERVECAWFAYRQAFRRATEQAQAVPVPKMISVECRLPIFNQEVMCLEGSNFYVAEYFESCTSENGIFFEEGFWVNGAASLLESVTHWMPLPKAQEQSHD